MRGVVCCLVALLASSCISVDSKPERVTIYRSKSITGDQGVPGRFMPHRVQPATLAVLDVNQDERVRLSICDGRDKLAYSLLDLECNQALKSYRMNDVVMSRSLRVTYRGINVGDVVVVFTAAISFHGDRPSKAVVFTEYIAEFDVKAALEGLDLADDETKEIADWFATFDERNMKRQRMVVEF
jgi:hypothetical protein